MNKFYYLVMFALLTLGIQRTNAQSGPGGKGDTSGSSDLVLWLKADAGVLNSGATAATNGQGVSTWQDQSGYGYDAVTAATSPVFDAANANFGNLPTITFAGGGTEFLFVEDDANEAPQLDNTTEMSVFYIFNADNSTGVRAHVSKRDGNNVSQSYVFFENGNINSRYNNNNDAGSNIVAGTTYINSATYDNGAFEHFLNQSSGGTVSGTTSIPGNDSDFNIGAFHAGDARTFDGDFAEIIVFREHLTNAERIVVETYLGSKYGLALTNDFWDETTYATYDNEIAGIGQHTDGTVANSATSGALTISGGNSRVNGDWMFFGHDDTDFATFSSTEIITGSGRERLTREWVVNETNDLGTVSVSIASSEISAPVPNPIYYLLVDSDGDADFSNATAFGMTFTGTSYTTDVDLNDGDRLAISVEAGDDTEIWYSYLTGNWNNPSNWTLDGALSASFVNPDSKVPGIGDSVVIQSGRTITADIDDIFIQRIEIIGTLDLAATTGHNLGNIEGNGTMRLSGAAGTDNYPNGSDEAFYDKDEGGTVEYYGGSIELNQSGNYNNLLLNLDNSTDVATFTASNIEVNGQFDISNGIFQFNDGASTNNLSLTVRGNLTVATNGGIDVSTANARHELNLLGNFTNQGDVDFTNRTAQITGSEATDGIVDVNFISPDSDQIVDLQNTTDFYRIEVNKGVDDTYVLEINADDPSFFNLYGFANGGTGGAQETTNSNALGLIYGTVKIGNNVTVSPLNASGNYNIYEGAQLWVDGGTVEKLAGTAIVPYGKVRVSAGFLNAPINSGITTRDNGQLTIEGGTVNVNQFRTSINGVSAQGGLIMSGGIFNIIGGSTSTSYYTFSLTYSGNVFNMSGGTINLSGTNTKGGIYINSSDENINVTGGTVNLDVTNGNNLTITSNAPFFNVNLLNSANSGNILISDGSSGTGAGETTLIPDGLTVLNDLRIDNSSANGTTFDANDFDLNITGSLTIDNGSVVDLTGMELTFDQIGGSSIDIQTGASLVLDTLIVNKTSETSTLNIVNGVANAITVNNYLNIEKGNLDLATFNMSVLGNLSVSDSIISTTGNLLLNGVVAQAITSDNGKIYNMEIDNVNGVSLVGDLSIIDDFALNNGIFDINTDKLTLFNPITTTGIFSSTLMVQTGGNPTDGGLEFLFDADESITYPFGIVGNYTPFVADIDTTNNDTGYIQVNPVNSKLGTLNDDVAVVDFLNYYWSVGNREFSDLPRINSYVFTYIDNAADDDVTGTESNLQPGLVEDGVDSDNDGDSFSRVPVGSTTDVNTATDEITFTFLATEDTLKTANYTAAEAAAFNGAVTVFYSRRSTVSGGGGVSDWLTAVNWSTDVVNQHEGAAATSYPGENSSSDVVVMGFGATDQDLATCDPCTIINTTRHDAQITATTITVAEIIFDQNPAASALNNIDTRIRVNNNATLNAGSVTGRGTMFQDVNGAAIGTINADFNEFNKDPDNGWFLRTRGSGNTLVVTDRFEFPTLRVFGNNDISYSQPVTARGLVVDSNADLFIDQDFDINGTAQMGLNQGGEIIFGTIGGGAVGSNVTFECDSLLLQTNASSSVSVTDIGSDTHTLRVNRGINLLVTGATMDLHNAATSNVTLELAGVGSNSFENTSGNIPELSRLILNKGADTTNVFTINTDFNLNGDNTTAPQALELQNGKLILNNSGINIELTNGINYSIPSTSGLEVTQGTVTSTGANIILDGLLRVNGGTVDLGTTDIEYSSSGSALISVTSGTLEVGGQVRRATTNSSGVLKYRQTGGDVDITTDQASVTSRAAFEVLNPGSEFTFTGGTFNIERGVTGDANESLELDPETFNVTGSNITIYENLGANYGANFFNIKSSIALNDVTIANSITLPTVRLFVQSLTVNNLTINSGQRFRANNLDLTLSGNLLNNGSYRNNSSNTTFSSAGAQSISGAGTFTIHDLTKEGSGTTSSSVNLTLGNDLRVSAGVLDIGSNSISLQNDAYIESTLTNSSGNGLVFNGTSGQDLYGLSNNIVSLGTVSISNPNGVDIPDGNGYDFDITQELRLNGGVFNIGGSLVTMKEGSTITEVSTFNENNMVQTNSSFTDNGFVIEFFGVDADTTIFFPVGELKYTPVQFDINAGATAGSIRVRPANERHPAIVDNVEPLTPPNTEIDDTQNSLQYYWVVVAENTTNVLGSATFFYDHDDILAIQSDTANFISGRLLSNGTTWDKFPPTFFNGASQTFTVPLDIGLGVSATEITGDYTAGLGSTDGINNNIEGALPDQLAQYVSNVVGSGNYSLDANWDAVAPSPALSSGIGPVGAQITISSGSVVTIDISNIRLFSTEIEEGGTLIVPAGVTNVRLGTVTGSGTIELTDTELLPVGEYTEFLACDGGALQYSGTTSFSVLSGISQIRKVTLSGTGVRSMPNNALNVCDTLIVNGPTVAFNSGQSFTIGDADTDRLDIQAGVVTISNGTNVVVTGDFNMSGGSLTGSSGTSISITDDVNYSGGTLSINNTSILLNGSTEQLVDGDFTGASALQNLTINNSSAAGVTVNGGDIEIDGILTLTDGLLNTSATETVTLTATGDWTSASVNSYVTGPITKNNIAVASTYEFPVGKSVRYAPAFIANIGTGGQNWTTEYFTSTNPTFPNTSFDNTDPGSGFNPISEVYASDRWEITSSGSNAAQIRLTYGTHLTISNEDDLRVVWWDLADSRWENQGGIVTGSATSGTVISENSIGFSTQQFGLAQAPEVPLPVEFIFFKAKLTSDNDVLLEWATATEINNDKFEIEKSYDGVNFEKIGEVTGNGTIFTQVNYSFEDELPGLGLNYYRLKQIDFDGENEYTPIVLVDNRNSDVSFEALLFPNPTNESEINLRTISGDLTSPVFVNIYDGHGRVFTSQVFEPEKLGQSVKLEMKNQMPAGIYFVMVQQGSERKQLRLVIR